MAVEIGDVAPDFVLKDQHGTELEGYEFGLLSDFWPHGAVARSYGVFDDERGLALRGTFIIDKSGVVRWKVVNPTPQARDLTAYQKALAELS